MIDGKDCVNAVRTSMPPFTGMSFIESISATFVPSDGLTNSTKKPLSSPGFVRSMPNRIVTIVVVVNEPAIGPEIVMPRAERPSPRSSWMPFCLVCLKVTVKTSVRPSGDESIEGATTFTVVVVPGRPPTDVKAASIPPLFGVDVLSK